MNQFELNKQIQQFILQKDKNAESYSTADRKFIAQYEGNGNGHGNGNGNG